MKTSDWDLNPEPPFVLCNPGNDQFRLMNLKFSQLIKQKYPLYAATFVIDSPESNEGYANGSDSVKTKQKTLL